MVSISMSTGASLLRRVRFLRGAVDKYRLTSGKGPRADAEAKFRLISAAATVSSLPDVVATDGRLTEVTATDGRLTDVAATVYRNRAR